MNSKATSLFLSTFFYGIFAISLALVAVTFVASADSQAQATKAAADVVLDTNGGFNIETADKQYGLNIGGRLIYDIIQFDGAFNRSNNAVQKTNQDIRNLRLKLTGHAKAWNFKVDYDFRRAAGVDSNNDSKDGFADLYAQYTGATNWAILTFGNFKAPFGYDSLDSRLRVIATERNVINQAFAPGRVLGASIGGYNDQFSYNFMVFEDDSSDNLEGDSAELSYAARVTWAPILEDNANLHLGVAFLQRSTDFNRNLFLTTGTVTIGDSREFSSITSISNLDPASVLRGADGVQFGPGSYGDLQAASFELAFAANAFFLQAEYISAEFDAVEDITAEYNLAGISVGSIQQDVTNSDIEPSFGGEGEKFNGYSVLLSWMLTGESRSYDSAKGLFGGIDPLASTGAWEVFVRLSHLDLRTDGDLVDNSNHLSDDLNGFRAYSTRFATGTGSSGDLAANRVMQELRGDDYRAMTYGVNYYLSRNVRISANFTQAEVNRVFYNGNDIQGTNEELDGDSFTMRLQYSF